MDVRKNPKNLVFFAILFGGGIFLFFNRHILEQFKNIKLMELLSPLAACLSGLIFLALGFKFLLKIFRINLSFIEWFGLTTCNIMFNYYLPAKGGTVAKAYYLKKEHDLKYSYFASLLTGSLLINLAVTSLAGLLAVAVFALCYRRLILSLVTIFGTLLAVGILVALTANFFLKYSFPFKTQKLTQFLENLKKGLTFFSNNKKMTLLYSLFYGLYLLAMVLRLHLSFRAMNVHASFTEMVIVRSLTEFSFFFSLIPGNLGIKEGIIVFSSRMFQITTEQAAAAALLDRAVGMFVIFGAGVVFSRILLGKFKK